MNLTIHESIPTTADEAARIIAQAIRPLPDKHTQMGYESLTRSLSTGRPAAVRRPSSDSCEYHSTWSVSSDEDGGKTVSASVMVVLQKGRGQLRVLRRPGSNENEEVSNENATGS